MFQLPSMPQHTSGYIRIVLLVTTKRSLPMFLAFYFFLWQKRKRLVSKISLYFYFFTTSPWADRFASQWDLNEAIGSVSSIYPSSYHSQNTLPYSLSPSILCLAFSLHFLQLEGRTDSRCQKQWTWLWFDSLDWLRLQIDYKLRQPAVILETGDHWWFSF